MEKLYSCSFSSHRASCPSGCLKFLSHLREPWSVRRVNWLPRRYGRKCWMKYTTASSSRRVTQYWRSGLLRARLAYAITRSVPSSCTCDSTAPIPESLASVSKTNGLEQSGNARIGVDNEAEFQKTYLDKMRCKVPVAHSFHASTQLIPLLHT